MTKAFTAGHSPSGSQTHCCTVSISTRMDCSSQPEQWVSHPDRTNNQYVHLYVPNLKGVNDRGRIRVKLWALAATIQTKADGQLHVVIFLFGCRDCCGIRNKQAARPDLERLKDPGSRDRMTSEICTFRAPADVNRCWPHPEPPLPQ